MTTIVTRAGKGTALSFTEMDANFTNLNTDKLETGSPATDISVTPAGGISSTNVQAALVEIDSDLSTLSTTVSTAVATQTHAASSKTSPVDADELPLADSASTFSLKKLTFASLKAAIKTYLDSYYIIRGGLDGAVLSTAGSSTTMSISAGQATDSTNTVSMALTAMTKTTASWAVGSGNGGLDTGSIANTTWYHWYIIQRVDTGVVDVLFSLSATSPTLPTNYTKFRRIGSWKTNGSGQWENIIQDGDIFYWKTFIADVAAANPGTAAVTRTLAGVPTGVTVIANVQLLLTNVGAGGASLGYLSDLATTDSAPAAASLSDTAATVSATGGASNSGGRVSVRTNTSAQIRSRISFSDASVTLRINTLGWTDFRGRNA